MNGHVFTSMSSKKIECLVRDASRRVVLAAPAFRTNVGEALAAAHERLGSCAVSVIVDCDEEVFRLGYGEIEAVTLLRDAGCSVRQSAGLRIGVLICDDLAWVFSPTALYIQPDVHSDETPNAVELRAADVERIIGRISPQQREVTEAPELPRSEIEDTGNPVTEIGQFAVSDDEMQSARESLEVAPPISFDIARQVRVFEPYIQYVEISMSGCAIQRHRVPIPKAIQGVGTASKIAERLKTTFDLIEKSSAVSSKLLEDELREIRDNFTRPLGKPWGRVLLRAVRPTFDDRMDEFREKLAEHKERVATDLEEHLNQSRAQVVEYYIPLVRRSPPDALLGQLMTQNPSDEQLKGWLDKELEHVFPTPKALIQDMKLEVQFRDVTFETLNERGFDQALAKAYPHVDWKRPFDEFKAAKERDTRD